MALLTAKAGKRTIGGISADALSVVAILVTYVAGEWLLLTVLQPYELYKILGFFLVTALFSNILAQFFASRARVYIV